MKEALEGLDNNSEDDDSTVPDEEVDLHLIHKRPVTAKNKKTIQQRRREKRLKLEVINIITKVQSKHIYTVFCCQKACFSYRAPHKW